MLIHFDLQKKLPSSMKNSESGAPLFKMVANCVIYKNNNWVVMINRRTMVDKVTTDAVNVKSQNSRSFPKYILQKILRKETDLPGMEVKEEEKLEVVDPPRRQNPKRGVQNIPADKTILDKKKRRPPPEHWQPGQHPNFQYTEDNLLIAKHMFNNVTLLDSAFLAKSNALKVKMTRNNMAVSCSIRIFQNK